MIAVVIAFRNLLRRKSRMIAIGLLVFFGTLLIIFGDTFSASAQYYAKQAIIDYFTGDFIVYSSRSKEKPTPFAFTTPLPLIQDLDKVLAFLSSHPDIARFVPVAQNYSLISIEDNGQKVELPFIFYAIDPMPFARTFMNFRVTEGTYFGTTDIALKAEDGYEPGVLLSNFQRSVFKKNYNADLAVGDTLTVLGLTQGGSVNAVKAKLLGFFDPEHFTNVFNYLNLLDIRTYATLYNFTGVSGSSLPADLNKAFSLDNESDIFALGSDANLGSVDVSTLKAEKLSGYTMIAVKLKNHDSLAASMKAITDANPTVLAAKWDDASGGFASISAAFQAFIYIATLLIFLVVALIFMNTLIINVIERTSEIGTMRAMGSEKSLIRGIFLAETFILNLVFMAAGMIAGTLIILLFGQRGVPLPETLAQYLIGGGSLPLRMTARPFIEATVVIAVVSVLATLYPIRVATKITPLKAMSEK
jgi:putative ABC transport system permease protein